MHQPFLVRTEQDLLQFSMKGLRTLCFAMRVIDRGFYEEWAAKVEQAKFEMILKAQEDPVSKDQKGYQVESLPLEDLYEEMEQQLFLLGTTGLEDRLQENVPQTIDDFRSAGIKVWMLTGDKLETAENIGFSSKLFSSSQMIFRLHTHSRARIRDLLKNALAIIELLEQNKEGLSKLKVDILNGENNQDDHWIRYPQEQHEQLKSKNQLVKQIIDQMVQDHQLVPFKFNFFEEKLDTNNHFALIIEGSTLQLILNSKEMTTKFMKILEKCASVIVSRASPSQKAAVVSLVRKNHRDKITLAIGDGANDVNMIRSAHVGIGIFGKEGHQAANNADYAVAQFRFLRRLLFVHGRWNANRLAKFLVLFFHKNIVYTVP
mmetsp:Transcript_30488/g.29879  ORF Transcript_30488/g.29879 Transcript_30488/m.29879 type:complete len:375 (-) Transcript_30488:959-2083(-)